MLDETHINAIMKSLTERRHQYILNGTTFYAEQKNLNILGRFGFAMQIFLGKKGTSIKEMF